MRINRIIVLAVFLAHCFFAHSYASVVVVNNSLKDIESHSGKLKLKLIRVWGGDDEEDENKFFNTPVSVAADGNKTVYICDQYRHCVKIFDYSGKYLRTIGRLGKGPTDLFSPISIALAPGGDLWVCESGGWRVQCFTPDGKSKTIFKTKGSAEWIGVTSKTEILVYDHQKTFDSRKLIGVYTAKGESIRGIGNYGDKSKNYSESERLIFDLDNGDNLYAAGLNIPVIRKYAPDGKLLMAMIYGTIYDIPVKIEVTQGGDEIDIQSEGKISEYQVKIKSNISKTVSYKMKEFVVFAIGTDSQKRLYIASKRRMITEKERKTFRITSTQYNINRSGIDTDSLKNIDYYRLAVFDSNGKIIAETPLNTLCEEIYIHDNRLFIIDGFINQRVLEYEMNFEK